MEITFFDNESIKRYKELAEDNPGIIINTSDPSFIICTADIHTVDNINGDDSIVFTFTTKKSFIKMLNAFPYYGVYCPSLNLDFAYDKFIQWMKQNDVIIKDYMAGQVLATVDYEVLTEEATKNV